MLVWRVVKGLPWRRPGNSQPSCGRRFLCRVLGAADVVGFSKLAGSDEGDGRSRPATTKGKSRAPSQKAGGIAGRTVTAEVDPAASAERRKQEYTADESEREAMTAKDAALREFDGQD